MPLYAVQLQLYLRLRASAASHLQRLLPVRNHAVAPARGRIRHAAASASLLPSGSSSGSACPRPCPLRARIHIGTIRTKIRLPLPSFLQLRVQVPVPPPRPHGHLLPRAQGQLVRRAGKVQVLKREGEAGRASGAGMSWEVCEAPHAVWAVRVCDPAGLGWVGGVLVLGARGFKAGFPWFKATGAGV